MENKEGFLGVVQDVLLAWNVRHVMCVICVHVIFFPACGIHSRYTPGFTALVSPVSNSVTLRAKFNIAQGKAVFVFALSSLPHAEDTNRKKQGEKTQKWSGNRFYGAGPNKRACVCALTGL